MTAKPLGADVSWGEIGWEAFEDLTCPSMSWTAADQVDICALFEAEVDQAHPTKITVDTYVSGSGESTQLVGLDLDFGGASVSSERFTGVFYHDGTKKRTARTDRNLYDPNGPGLDDPAGDGALTGIITKIGTAETDTRTTATVWVPLLDADNDPMYGDLGKVDTTNSSSTNTGFDGGNDVADNFGAGRAGTSSTTNADATKCSADDGGAAATKDASGNKKGDSTLCDAEGVEIETTVVFTDDFGAHECSVEKTYTITCDWDASGGMNTGRDAASAAADAIADDGTDIGKFLSCKVS